MAVEPRGPNVQRPPAESATTTSYSYQGAPSFTSSSAPASAGERNAVQLVSDNSASPTAAPRVALARVENRLPGPMMPRSVLHVDETTFERQVLRSDEPVLVDFYATWCGPCKRLAPALDEVAAESPQIKIVKVDIDGSPGLAEQYGVQSIPTLLVFKNGQVVARQTGGMGKSRVKAMLDL
jgi:thioredoxin